jgi:hypothetical protein
MKRARKSLLIVAHTTGEFEAGISASSAMGCIPIVYIGTNVIFKNFINKNISFYRKMMGTDIQITKGSFSKIWPSLLLKKVSGHKVAVSMNFFDSRHIFIYRFLFRITANFIIRDSIIPHQKPPKYKEYKYLPALICEENIAREVYKGFKIYSAKKSSIIENIEKYLQNNLGTSRENKVTIFTKNVAASEQYIQNKYYEKIIQLFGREYKISFKIHPRDNFSKTFCTKNNINISEENIFDLSIKSEIVIIFGGSSGWLGQYHKKIIYIADPTFNRSLKKFDNVKNINDISELSANVLEYDN